MFRIKLALIVAGGVVGFMGYEEFMLSSMAQEEPLVANLAEIEAMDTLENAHIQLDTHEAFYSGLVYEYQQGKYETGEPMNSTKVTTTYYPIISQQHPFMVSLNALYQKYPDGIPEDMQFPEIRDIKVIVKTDRFKTIGALPEAYLTTENGLQGLVINEIETLDGEEATLIRESFPHVKLDEVFLLEEGRAPASSGKTFGMMGGGAVLFLLGLGWLISGFKGR